METRLPLCDFDKSLLDEPNKNSQGIELRKAVQAYLEAQFDPRTTTVQVTSSEIILRKSETAGDDDILARAIENLNQGDYAKGTSLLETALLFSPDSPEILYNLGMALSDLGRLDEAKELLQKLVKNEPKNARAWLALGVCFARLNEQTPALESFSHAHSLDDQDFYTLKTLGSYMAEVGDDLTQANSLLEKAIRLMPNDQQTRFNYGLLKCKLGQIKEAESAFAFVKQLNPHNQIADAATDELNKISEQKYKANQPARETSNDPVQHCYNALKHMSELSDEDSKILTAEIATLGMKGLDVNSDEAKYSLRNLSGTFTGMQLLCIQYVGFQRIDPSIDIGFDLSKEYQQAQQRLLED